MGNKALYPPIEMPEVSVGVCKNSRNCKAYATDLANGWCINCWDKGKFNTKKNIEVNIKRREDEKQTKLLLKEVRARKTKYLNSTPHGRGRHKKDCQCEIHLNKEFV